jgi:hypothetical protein
MADKEKPNLPLKAEAFWHPQDFNKDTKTFEKPRLELRLELLPTSELSHHQLAAMFDKDVEVSVDSTNEQSILKVVVTFEHDKDAAGEGKAEHDLHLAARDKGMSVPAYREWKAAEERKAADAKAAADKAAKKAAKPEPPAAT